MSIAPIVDSKGLPVYVPGASTVPGTNEVLKLSSNESALGPSPLAIAAYQSAVTTLRRYPDPECLDLKAGVAEASGLDVRKILFGAGSESLVRLIARTFSGAGDEIVHSQYAFSLYRIAAHCAGAVPVAAPEENHTAQVDAILSAVSKKTRIVFLANPNNPTGTILREREIRRLAEELPGDILLVLDAAYEHYVQHGDYDAGRSLVDEGRDNVIVLGTFSKIFGLAGLRIGWAYTSEEMVDTLRKVSDVFALSVPAQVCALAALADKDHTARELEHVCRSRAWMLKKLKGLGFRVTPSETNFLLIHCDGLQISGKDCVDALRDRGILVRPVANYGMPEAMRLTMGKENENRAVLAALAEIVN